MKKKLNKKSTIALITVLAVSLFAGINSAIGGLPSSKTAVAGSNVKYLEDDEALPLLEAQIKTANKKDLIISVSAECVLLTDTKIKGKDELWDEDRDYASIKVWVEVDGERAFPDEVTFAERLQILKGRLSAVTYNSTNDVIYMAEEVELLLNTTSANCFNFLLLNLDSGEHTVRVMADIKTVDEADDTYHAFGIIGDRTIVVQEVRLIQDAEIMVK
jgi:hypothetical protein